VVDVMKFFEIKAAQFRLEWAALTAEDKAQLRVGIQNGTLTY
jgi:hypothetical protein